MALGWGVWFAVAGEDRAALLVEDGPIETATAIVLFVAFVAGVWLMRRPPKPAVYWLVPSFALLAMLDELSFGARIFGFGSPTIADVEVDTLHDVFDIADRVLGDMGIGRTTAAAVVLAAVAALTAVLVATGRARRLVRWFDARRPLVFVGAAVAMLGVAVVIDQIAATELSRFVEEMLEFGAAFVVLYGTSAIQGEADLSEVTV